MVDPHLLDKLKKIQATGIINYASPTTDHMYKKVFLNSLSQGENKIGRDFCNAMLRIMTKNDSLTVRKVEVMSEHVDGVFKNFYLAVKAFVDVPEQQNLKVDALFCADMNDNRRAEKPATKSGKGPQNPAYVLGEMQVGQQNFGARLLSYACKILSGCNIDLKNNVMPPPVYAMGFCMWNSGELVKGPRGISSKDLDIDSTGNEFTEIFCTNVFLGDYVKILKTDTRDSIDSKLVSAQNTLKEKVVKFFKGDKWTNASDNSASGKFNALDVTEKKVYLWLEFLAFAHLMTEGQKDVSLQCLGGDDAVDIFNEAYGIVKFNFEGKNMEKTGNGYNYLELYGLADLSVVLTSAKFVETAIKKNKGVFLSNPTLFVEPIDENLRNEVYKELKDRKVDEEALRAFESEVKKLATPLQ
jgi:hypothetical protein